MNAKSSMVLASATVLLSGIPSQNARAQSLLDISATSILAPSLPPSGGYGANPQEYLTVSWSVVENASGNYLYSYTVSNPAGDVLMTPTGGLTSTPEIFDAFSVDFNTTSPGEYLPGSQTGGAFQEANTVDLVWFFNPSVPAGTSGPTVSFESDFPPTSGNASADGAIPWSSVSMNGQQVPVPDAPAAVPEPTTSTLLFLTTLLLVPFRGILRRFLLQSSEPCS